MGVKKPKSIFEPTFFFEDDGDTKAVSLPLQGSTEYKCFTSQSGGIIGQSIGCIGIYFRRCPKIIPLLLAE